jgi:hypothetical protein
MKYLLVIILLLFNISSLAQSINVKGDNYLTPAGRDSEIVNQAVKSQDIVSLDTSISNMRTYEKYRIFIKPLIGGDNVDQSFNINLIPSQRSVVSYNLSPIHIGISLGLVLNHSKKPRPDLNRTCVWEFPGSCFMGYSYAPNCVDHYISVHYIFYDGTTDIKENRNFIIKTNDIELNGTAFNKIFYECNEIGIDYGINFFGFFITLGLSYTNEKNSISFSVQDTDKKDYVVEKNGYKSVVFKYGVDCNWVYIKMQYVFNKHNQFFQTQNAWSIGTGFPLWFLRSE